MTTSPQPREGRSRPHASARQLRDAVDLAREEAAERASSSIEAEHLLIALARLPQSRGGAFLVANGLGPDELGAALLTERRHSLDSVGAPTYSPEQLRATRRPRQPRIGTSSRDALERGMRVSRGHQGSDTLPLVVGVLSAELGTVPRMLSLIGVDRHQLLGRAMVEASGA